MIFFEISLIKTIVCNKDDARRITQTRMSSLFEMQSKINDCTSLILYIFQSKDDKYAFVLRLFTLKKLFCLKKDDDFEFNKYFSHHLERNPLQKMI